MDPDNPTLNADGSLKNADEIEWDHSPTQQNRILPPIRPSVSKPTAPIFQSGNQLGPEHFGGSKRKQNEPASMTKTTTSKSTESAHGSKGKDGTTTKAIKKTKAVKPVAINRLKASSTLRTNQSSSLFATAASTVADSDDEDADKPIRKKRRRGDGSADVLTVFELVDPDDAGEGYECQICV
jgi:prophage DNA circulation protein